jgi:hypothetical protein
VRPVILRQVGGHIGIQYPDATYIYTDNTVRRLPGRVPWPDDDARGEKFGTLMSREEYIALDPGEVYDDPTYAGCCGAPGVVFRHRNGCVALADAKEVEIEAEPPLRVA